MTRSPGRYGERSTEHCSDRYSERWTDRYSERTTDAEIEIEIEIERPVVTLICGRNASRHYVPAANEIPTEGHLCSLNRNQPVSNPRTRAHGRSDRAECRACWHPVPAHNTDGCGICTCPATYEELGGEL